MSHNLPPLPPVRRNPEMVLKYFVAPPNESDRSVGRTLAFSGGGLVAAGWLSLILLPAIAGSSDQSGGGALVGGIFGALFFFFGNALGWPLFILGVRRLYAYSRQRNARFGAPADAEMDRWLAEDIERVRGYGLTELNLPSDRFTREPLVVMGPSLPTDYALGWDGVPRFAGYEAALVCLTDTSIGVFSCIINFLTGDINLETTHEFAFADVTTIATFNDRTAAHGGGSSDGRTVRMRGPIAMNYVSLADVNVRQEFRISLTNGEAIAVNVGAHINGVNLTNEAFRAYVRQTVKALRSTLREIKSV